jgi:hypothetical protein
MPLLYHDHVLDVRHVTLRPKSNQTLTRTMSQAAVADSASSPPSSTFLSVFNAAIETYEKTAKDKLLTHPLAIQIQSCDTPADILSVLQDLVQQLDENRSSNQGLTNWLGPTVNVLFAFSATLGAGVGLVCQAAISSK